MTTLRHMYWLTFLAPAILVLAQPAAAQTDEPPDTVYVDAEETVIILDGKRIIVKSMDTGEGHRFTLEREMDVDFPRIHMQGRNFHMPGRNFDIEIHKSKLRPGIVKSMGIAKSMREKLEEMVMDVDDDVRQLELEAQRLARAVRGAEGDERTRLNDELAEKLGEIFDHKQELRQEEIDRLQSQLDKAVGKREEREGIREEIIRRRMDQLIGNSRYEW